jgi:hypothetical protein
VEDVVIGIAPLSGERAQNFASGLDEGPDVIPTRDDDADDTGLPEEFVT